MISLSSQKFKVLVSKTTQKQLDILGKELKKRIKKHLKVLEKNPFEKRSGADIKYLAGSDPKLYRLRVGDYRAIYYIENKIVKVTEISKRGTAYKILG